MSVFSDSLKTLRGPTSQSQFAAELGMKQQQYARYENGVTVPSIDILATICRAHACSADWLLGLPSRGGSTTVTAGKGAAVSLGSGNATASNCRDCPILLDFINRRSGGRK